jgi:hypothetical protein
VHVLAQIGKRESNGVLSGAVPTCVSTLIANDCKKYYFIINKAHGFPQKNHKKVNDSSTVVNQSCEK